MASPRFTAIFGTSIDNFIHVPLFYLPAFYTTTGVIQGDSIEKIKKTGAENWWTSTWMCWSVWIPTQAINFYFVAQHRQVLVVSSVNFFWNIYLDHLKHIPEVEGA